MPKLNDANEPVGPRETRAVALIALALGAIAGLVFSMFPQIDIRVSALFYSPGDGFALNGGFWNFLRTLSLRGFTIWYILVIAAGILAARIDRAVLGLDWKRWLYMGVCSLLGPLLLTNVVLKEHWGRWRPREILELGGSESFSPVLMPIGTCLDNCSFVSGEVSSMVMIFAALAFVSTSWRPAMWALTIAMGLLSALMRVGQGGHFLSDSIFAGVFMVLIAALVYWAMFLSAYARADEAGRRRMEARLLAAHDRFWEQVCQRGLKLLDAMAPRR